MGETDPGARRAVRTVGTRDGFRHLRADDGIRTRDPHLGKVMLYQLSHVRTCRPPALAGEPGRPSPAPAGAFSTVADPRPPANSTPAVSDRQFIAEAARPGGRQVLRAEAQVAGCQPCEQ